MPTDATIADDKRPLLKTRRAWPRWTWTLLGGLAIPLWATWPALSLKTHELPALECLAIVFFVAWFTSNTLERTVVIAANALGSSWRSWIPAATFGLAEVGSAALFLLATRHIDAAEANLVVYLWPGIVVSVGASVGIFQLKLRHLAGIALGFAGIAILAGGERLSLSFIGIGLAFLAGLSWALYCVLRLKWHGPTGPLLARGFAVATGVCVGLHLLTEPTVMPTVTAAAASAAVGIVPTAVANVMWDEGFRKGDSQLLAVMAYATPLCSTALLTLLGLESLTWRLLLGAVVIVIAGAMSRADVKRGGPTQS
jgi:drug/metabolite transporter (DMT)-like permease